MAMLWREAKVPPRVWDKGHGRKKSAVHHAFRKGFKTGLAELDVTREIRDFLVGHHQGIDEHYLDLDRKARAAVALIPPLSDDAAAGQIINFPQQARP
jgi:hypothetical protein